MIVPTQRLTIPEAATELGVSEVTVRRRLKAGTLHGEQEETAQGYRWVVTLETPDEETDHEPDQTATHDQVRGDHALVVSLEDQIGFLRRELEVRNTELAEMRRLLLAATQQQNHSPALNAEIRSPTPTAEESATTYREGFSNFLQRLLAKLR